LQKSHPTKDAEKSPEKGPIMVFRKKSAPQKRTPRKKPTINLASTSPRRQRQRPRERAHGLTRRALIIDIETTPWQAVGFGPVWKPSILEVTKQSYVLCVAWSWSNEERVQVRSLLDYPWTWKRDFSNDRELIRDVCGPDGVLFQAAEERAIVVGHHLDGFDLKVLRARAAYHQGAEYHQGGLKPIPPLKSFDTKKASNKLFGPALPSHRLDYICRYYGLGEKIKTDKDLWLDAMNGDETALRRMARYCQHDIKVTRNLYNHLRALGAPHPKMNHFIDDRPSCHVCGGDVIFRGPTFNGKKRRVSCRSCFSWGEAPL
jgi:hypothetical protein